MEKTDFKHRSTPETPMGSPPIAVVCQARVKHGFEQEIKRPSGRHHHKSRSWNGDVLVRSGTHTVVGHVGQYSVSRPRFLDQPELCLKTHRGDHTPFPKASFAWVVLAVSIVSDDVCFEGPILRWR